MPQTIAFSDVLARWYEKRNNQFLAIMDRTEQRMSATLRQLARETDDAILRAARDEDTYLARLKSFRTSIDAAMRDATEREVNIIRRGRIDAINYALDAAVNMGRFTRQRMDVKLNPGVATGDLRADTLAFLNRYPYGGVPLSERVWRINDQTMSSIFGAVHRGVMTGKANDVIARDVRHNLIDPEGTARAAGVVKALRTRARKARDLGERDRYRTLMAAARERENELPKPGRGVYRSAFKNAMRVARSEAVRAQQEAALLYATRKRWVVGIRWNVTPGTDCPICLALVGIYEIGSAPAFPHPHCMCYVTNVVDPALSGEDPGELKAAPDDIDPFAKRSYWQRRIEAALKKQRLAAQQPPQPAPVRPVQAA